MGPNVGDRSHRVDHPLLDQLSTAAYTTDAAGRITYFNEACIAFSGRIPRPGPDQWCVTWKLYHPCGSRMLHEECPLAIALKEGRIVKHIAIAERPDGTRVWFMRSPSLLRNESGEIIGALNMLVEIAERTDIERQNRREADARLLAELGSQVVIADQPQIIYEKIMDAAVLLLRSQFASMQVFHPNRGDFGELQLLAHRGFDPASTKFWEWVRGDSTCVCGLTLRAGSRVVIREASSSVQLDDGQKHAYGSAGIVGMQSTPLLSRSGKLLGMISTHWDHPYEPTASELSNFDILARQAADIFERASAEETLRRLNEELEQRVLERTSDLMEMNEQLQGFTYSVAHDLRQQIRGICTKVSMLKLDAAEALGDESKETLTRLAWNTKMLARLVDDLLAYARLGRHEPTLLPIDMSALAEEVVTHVIEQDGCNPDCRFRIAPGMKAEGDVSMLRIVVENLLVNAAKFSSTTESPLVEVGIHEEAFFVKDNGVGFDMQYSGRLFLPFERLHGEQFSGTGIGLASVKRIVEKHGGRVWTDAAPSKGATFYFTLPRVAACS